MANVKRILIVLPDLGMSGAVFAALNLVPDFLTAGCAVMVAALGDGERAGLFSAAGAKVEVRPALAGLLAWPWSRIAAVEAARGFKPDVVHAMSTDAAVVGARLARACGAPLAVTVNRLDKNQALSSLPRGGHWGLIALSDAIQEQLTIGLRFPRERSVVIPNGLNLRWFPRPQDGLRDTIKMRRVPVVGTYGTLAEMKGQRDFLQAAACVLARGRDAEFLVMGHGPDKEQLRELAEKIKISKRLTFSASTITDSRNITNIDIFVEPTKREGFGLSVLQAMATGVPVVACGVGGIYSLIKDGETGLLVGANDVPAMSDAICRLLDAPALRDELAHNARLRVEKEFDAKLIVQRLLAYYDALAARAT